MRREFDELKNLVSTYLEQEAMNQAMAKSKFFLIYFRV
jgi:hypothetical protein